MLVEYFSAEMEGLGGMGSAEGWLEAWADMV